MRVDRPQRMRPALRAFVVLATLALASPGLALADGFRRDRTPLPKGISGAADSAPTHTGSGSYLRLLVGLAIVVGLIYAIYRLLKRANRVGAAGRLDALSVFATAPLGPNRAVHLVRVGPEVILVGSAEHGVTGLRVYSAEEVSELLGDLDSGSGPFTPTGGGRGLAAAFDDLRRRTARR